MVTFVFTTDPKSWVSKIIRWFTKSLFSHSAIFVDTDILGTLVVESDAGGVQVQTHAMFDVPGNTVIKTYTPKIDLVPALKLTMTRTLNEEYDYTGLIGMAWVMFWRWLKVKVHNPLHDSKALFCSAFLVKVLQAANELADSDPPFPGVEDLVPQDTNAQDVWEYLSSLAA